LVLGIDAPLRVPVYFCLFNILWTYLASILTGNCSQVDRVWTFLPTLYTTWFTFFPTFDSSPLSYRLNGVSPRAYLVWVLQVLWTIRLTYNAWRRGMFALNEEDYRWEVLRKKMPKWLFQVVNLTFIAIIQNILLFMLGLPAYQVLRASTASLEVSDLILGVLCVATLATEFIADNQQWSYQNFKHGGGKVNPNEWPGANIQWTEADRKRGFVSRGLWAWSRHPNFACEQTFWILISCFSIFASPKLDKLSTDNLTPLWPLVPALSLCALFFSSTKFSEGISKQKYPKAYGAYQSRVGMFVPMLTLLKGFVLSAINKEQAAEIDEQVWGDSTKVKSD